MRFTQSIKSSPRQLAFIFPFLFVLNLTFFSLTFIFSFYFTTTWGHKELLPKRSRNSFFKEMQNPNLGSHSLMFNCSQKQFNTCLKLRRKL